MRARKRVPGIKHLSIAMCPGLSVNEHIKGQVLKFLLKNPDFPGAIINSTHFAWLYKFKICLSPNIFLRQFDSEINKTMRVTHRANLYIFVL